MEEKGASPHSRNTAVSICLAFANYLRDAIKMRSKLLEQKERNNMTKKWFPEPKYPNNQTQQGVGSLSPATPEMPQLSMPETNDTIEVVVHPWGHTELVTPNTQIQKGSKVIEATVTGVKTANIVLE